LGSLSSVTSEPYWDPFLRPVSLEAGYDPFVMPVTSEPMLQTLWFLAEILCSGFLNRFKCGGSVLVPFLHCLQGSRGRGLPILSQLGQPHYPRISFKNLHAMNYPALDRYFSSTVHDQFDLFLY
jgi:hypothetical protein